MAYDADKDEVSWSGESAELGLEAKVVSYAGGTAKVQLGRFVTRQAQRVYTKLGRTTAEEARWLAARLLEAAEFIEREATKRVA